MARKAYVIEENFIKRELPEGYTQIEFIEASGAQYIDTGFRPNQDTRVVMDAQMVSSGNSQFYFGARTSAGAVSYGFLIASGAHRSDYGESRTNIDGVELTERLLIDKNRNVCAVGSVTAINSGGTFQSTFNMFLFASNDGGVVKYNGSLRLYSCQIYDAGVIVRDFVPCKTTSGTLGLYDLENEYFYTNAGSGAFTGGSEHTNVRNVPKIYIGIEKITDMPLPEGYTRVEYIESSGTQYVKTGFKPNQNTRVVLDAEVLSSNNTGQVQILSVTDGTMFFVLRLKDDFSTFQARRGRGTLFSVSCDGGVYGRHLFDMNKSVISVDGVQTVDTERTFSIDYDIYIGTQNNKGSIAGYSKLKIYSCLIYDNGVIARAFVPCVKTNGEAGLFDVVGGEFYGNAGSGAFSSVGTVDSGQASGVARKVKKGYISVGRKARPFWGEDPAVVYYGNATSLSQAREDICSVSNGEVALFVGGSDRGVYTGYNNVDIYNKYLVKSVASHPISVCEAAGATIGDFMLVAGGRNGKEGYVSDVYAYNKALTVSLVSALSVARTQIGGTANDNYALFGGGYNGVNCATVDAYDASLTRRNPAELSKARPNAGGVNAGEFALFAGGEYSKCIDAYNGSLVRVAAEDLSENKYLPSVAKAGEYAVVSAGGDGYLLTDAYDPQLIKRQLDALSECEGAFPGFSLGQYAIIAKGDHVDTYSWTLVHGVVSVSELYDRRVDVIMAGASVGNYGLVAGGSDGRDAIDHVSAYTVL